MVNKVQAGKIDDDVQKLDKAKFIHESDKNCPKGALRIDAKNEPAVERNEVFLIDLLGELYTIKAD